MQVDEEVEEEEVEEEGFSNVEEEVIARQGGEGSADDDEDEEDPEDSDQDDQSRSLQGMHIQEWSGSDQ